MILTTSWMYWKGSCGNEQNFDLSKFVDKTNPQKLHNPEWALPKDQCR